MPELPEVEAVCRKLRKTAVGARIVDAHIERRRITAPRSPEEVEELVTGRSIESVTRRGKNILVSLSGGLVMHVHLRMTGDLYVIPDWRLRATATNAWFAFEDGRGLVFRDTRGLGSLRVLDDAQLRTLLAQIGPEPLSAAFSNEALLRSAAGSRQPIKLFLMDQRRVAGPGKHLCGRGAVSSRYRSARSGRLAEGAAPRSAACGHCRRFARCGKISL